MDNQIVDRPARHASEPHVAIAIVCDVSASMREKHSQSNKTPIQLLNDAINNMIQEMKTDARLKNIVDISIFVFGAKDRKKHIELGFRAIADCEKISMEALDANTYVADALEQAVNVLQRRCAIYDKAGGSYKPWIVLVTDGKFHDDDSRLTEVGNVIKQREQEDKMNFFGLGVDRYDRTQLEKFTNQPSRVIDARVENFVEFFSWIGRSIKVVSTSAINQVVKSEPLQFQL